MKNTYPNDIFTCKKLFFVLKVVYSAQYIFSLCDSGNCYFLVCQNACPKSDFYLPWAIGQALMYHPA